VNAGQTVSPVPLRQVSDSSSQRRPAPASVPPRPRRQQRTMSLRSSAFHRLGHGLRQASDSLHAAL